MLSIRGEFSRHPSIREGLSSNFEIVKKDFPYYKEKIEKHIQEIKYKITKKNPSILQTEEYLGNVKDSLQYVYAQSDHGTKCIDAAQAKELLELMKKYEDLVKECARNEKEKLQHAYLGEEARDLHASFSISREISDLEFSLEKGFSKKIQVVVLGKLTELENKLKSTREIIEEAKKGFTELRDFEKAKEALRDLEEAKKDFTELRNIFLLVYTRTDDGNDLEESERTALTQLMKKYETSRKQYFSIDIQKLSRPGRGAEAQQKHTDIGRAPSTEKHLEDPDWIEEPQQQISQRYTDMGTALSVEKLLEKLIHEPSLPTAQGIARGELKPRTTTDTKYTPPKRWEVLEKFSAYREVVERNIQTVTDMVTRGDLPLEDLGRYLDEAFMVTHSVRAPLTEKSLRDQPVAVGVAELMNKVLDNMRDSLLYVCAKSDYGKGFKDPTHGKDLLGLMEKYEALASLYSQYEKKKLGKEFYGITPHVHESFSISKEIKALAESIAQGMTKTVQGKTEATREEKASHSTLEGFLSALAIFTPSFLPPRIQRPAVSLQSQKTEDVSKSAQAEIRILKKIIPQEREAIAAALKSSTLVERYKGASLTGEILLDENLISEGVEILEKLKGTVTTSDPIRSFALLRRVLARASSFILGSKTPIEGKDKATVIKAIETYNGLVQKWGDGVQDKKGFIDTMLLPEDLKNEEKRRALELEFTERSTAEKAKKAQKDLQAKEEEATRKKGEGEKKAQEAKKADDLRRAQEFKAEKKPAQKPTSYSSEITNALRRFKKWPEMQFGKTNFVRYMVRYRLGCLMQKAVEEKPRTAEERRNLFTIDGLLTDRTEPTRTTPTDYLKGIVSEAERVEHNRVFVFNELQLLKKDLESRIGKISDQIKEAEGGDQHLNKKEKAEQHRKLEQLSGDIGRLRGALQKIVDADSALTTQAQRFETIASFIELVQPKEGSKLGLVFEFTKVPEEYEALKKRIVEAQDSVKEVRQDFKGGRK